MRSVCPECGGCLPMAHRLTCSARRGEIWRVFRFERADGSYCEVASNHVKPDQIDLPPGYHFVCATPLVADLEAGNP